MRLVKLGLISLLMFALLLTLISFFFPSHVRISKAINIAASRDTVLSRIHKPEQWMPGYDTAGLWGYEPSLATPSARQNTARLVVENGLKFTSDASPRVTYGWNLMSDLYPDSVTVQAYMDFKIRWYPWEKFSSLLFENRYGRFLERELAVLKQITEETRPSNK